MHAAPAVFAERLRQQIAELRVNHDCDEHLWRYRHGGGYCNECNDNLPMFMMVSVLFALSILPCTHTTISLRVQRCTRCQILACKRCARNRL
jgi:hypothetical protein